MKHSSSVKLTIPVMILIGAVLACTFPGQSPPTPVPTPTFPLIIIPSATATFEPTETPLPPTLTMAAFLCPRSMSPRVIIGDQARVTFSNGKPLRVRKDPEFKPDNVLGQLAEGTEFKVIGGPVCVPAPDSGNNYVFWKIKVETPAFTGWVAEGDQIDYFIEPLR